MRYGTEFCGDCGDLGAYHVNLPLTGGFAASQAGRPISGDGVHAAVYRPVGETVLRRVSADCRFLALKMDRAAVEQQLAADLDAPVRGPLRLAERLDLRRPPGRGCADLIRLLAAEIDNPTGLVYQPLVAAPLAKPIVASLLLAVDHQYHDALAGRAPRPSAPAVSRAVDAIRAEPRHPYTVAELAGIAGVGVRSLRQEFRRRTGMTPMAYLWEARLAGAHAELLTADARITSVAEVAHRWGFTRRGSFAVRYRARYHRAPSDM
jgi:AraC-like DNA-binding protein